MKIYSEISLENFEPWSGAVSRFEEFQKMGALPQLEEELEELYPDGISETDINDLFWFEEDWLRSLIGLTVEE